MYLREQLAVALIAISCIFTTAFADTGQTSLVQPAAVSQFDSMPPAVGQDAGVTAPIINAVTASRQAVAQREPVTGTLYILGVSLIGFAVVARRRRVPLSIARRVGEAG